MSFILERTAPSSAKKWKIIGPHKTVSFGAKGYQDFTQHKDPDRQDNYLTRHRRNETWTKSGATTAGFWSRWLLWNKPSLAASIRDVKQRFGFTIRQRRR
jgi:hypothetical protein